MGKRHPTSDVAFFGPHILKFGHYGAAENDILALQKEARRATAMFFCAEAHVGPDGMRAWPLVAREITNQRWPQRRGLFWDQRSLAIARATRGHARIPPGPT